MLIDNIGRLRLLDFDISIVDVHALDCPKGDIVDNTTNGRRYYLLHLITKGFREYIVNGEHLNCDEGTIIFIPDKTRYFSQNQDKCSGIGICFTIEGDFQMAEKVYFSRDITGEFKRKAFELHTSFFMNRSDILNHKAIMYRLLEIATRQPKRDKYWLLIEPAMQLLGNTFKQNLPLTTYAKECNLSPSYFRKIFQASTGVSFIKYRNRLRLDLAIRLKEMGLNSEQIADECGFCNVSYMRRVFKSETGKPFSKLNYSNIV